MKFTEGRWYETADSGTYMMKVHGGVLIRVRSYVVENGRCIAAHEALQFITCWQTDAWAMMTSAGCTAAGERK